jgi:hypothetical protein
LTKCDEENTVLHHASFSGNVKTLERIWMWANGQLAAEKLSNKFLLASGYNRQTAWHIATQRGRKIVGVGQKDTKHTDELNNDLLLAKND